MIPDSSDNVRPVSRVVVVAGGADGLPGGGQVPGEQLDPCQDATGPALPLRAADGVGDVDGLPAVPGALLPRPQVAVYLPQAGEVHGFDVAVADLPGDGQRLLIQLDGPDVLAEVAVAVGEVAQVGWPRPPGQPISRSMASACSYSSMARAVWPRSP